MKQRTTKQHAPNLSKPKAHSLYSLSISNSIFSQITKTHHLMFMETSNKYSFPLFCSFIISSALLSFAFCVAAEFKKSKKEDLLFDGKLCYLPRSGAFGLGVAALISLCIGQVIGTFFVCGKFHARGQSSGCKVKKPTASLALLVFSWISFGIAAILIGTATSMSQSQDFGEGWLDGECYMVKDGLFAGSAIIVLLALSSIHGLGVIKMRLERQADENKKVYAQTDG